MQPYADLTRRFSVICNPRKRLFILAPFLKKIGTHTRTARNRGYATVRHRNKVTRNCYYQLLILIPAGHFCNLRWFAVTEWMEMASNIDTDTHLLGLTGRNSHLSVF